MFVEVKPAPAAVRVVPASPLLLRSVQAASLFLPRPLQAVSLLLPRPVQAASLLLRPRCGDQ